MKNAKIHTSSFFLETALLQSIDEIAEILGVSRSIVVERAVFGKEKGFDNAERKIKPKKNKKKFLLRESNIRRINRNARKQKLSKNAYLISVINEYLEFVSRNNLLVYEYRKDS
ncbi:hypothetical protein HW260_01160 [Helicobacter cinaedi]|uniref:hypothetical protein n=1 Tax=Helicobacter cinaedi TaxID=213 RepID=UPI000CF11971|nr:hypothetical protein [Helicobacter cinaedi]AWK62254.1 hypothetical protein C6B36_07805 [Helicobacter cinaedi]QOQ91004.1 hypothetical protein HW260_01160 [Helicobacter cinaedi]QOQ95198.1 hypothetical protein HW245_05720 [Helicobacter cinaedi]BBB20681.1 hypothetical protein HC081234_18580 [Helicobacter cinaedi]